jgi:uncharacterized membrane protein
MVIAAYLLLAAIAGAVLGYALGGWISMAVGLILLPAVVLTTHRVRRRRPPNRR